MQYTVRLDDNPRRAHINYQCPCGCTAGVLYDRDGVFSEVGECCCGRKMWAGEDGEAHIHSYLDPATDYAWDTGEVALPWGEKVSTALAVPVSELEETSHDDNGAHTHAHPQEDLLLMAEAPRVRDVVCGMMIDPASAAATSSHRGETYYFCSAGCKALFDGNPGRFITANRGFFSRLFRR